MVAPFLRRGLLRPFGRDQKGGFAKGSGDDLLISRLGQILAAGGEVPWKPQFDGHLERLRNQGSSLMLREFAKVYVRDAIATFEPSVTVLDVQATRDATAIRLKVNCQRVEDDGRARVFDVTAAIQNT